MDDHRQQIRKYSKLHCSLSVTWMITDTTNKVVQETTSFIIRDMDDHRQQIRKYSKLRRL